MAKQQLTAERAMEILRAERLQRENWYPNPNDLELQNVPLEVRADVREALNFLGKIPIQARDGSWLIAQAIAQLGDPRVQYAEGLMSVGGDKKVVPSAWNLIDTHIVSLFTEFKNRIEPPQVWMYEPLKIYPLADIYEARKAGHPTCSGHDWLKTVVGKTPDYSVLEKVFKAPLQRMLDRKRSENQYIELDWN